MFPELKNTGGPAFPSQPLDRQGQPEQALHPGMTLREWLAGQALGAVILRINDQDTFKAFREVQKETGLSAVDLTAQATIEYADALLKALKPTN